MTKRSGFKMCLRDMDLSQHVVARAGQRMGTTNAAGGAPGIDELWVDERSRQKLLESFGQLTIQDLIDG